MDDQTFTNLENHLGSVAAALPYPSTPDLSSGFLLSRRAPVLRLGWAFGILLALLASSLAVPSVRARVLEFLQVGAVRILIPQGEDQSGSTIGRKHKEHREEEIIVSILDLDGEISLQEARDAVSFAIDIPTYPEDLGEPDRVFLQHMDTGDFVVLAWLDGDGEPELVEYVIGPGVYLLKGTPEIVEETVVNGVLGVWARGQYLLQIEGYHLPVQFVHGPALIWAVGDLTYRLEGSLSEDEMVRIAESISQ